MKPKLPAHILTITILSVFQNHVILQIFTVGIFLNLSRKNS